LDGTGSTETRTPLSQSAGGRDCVRSR
jgi:hypothetical protein